MRTKLLVYQLYCIIHIFFDKSNIQPKGPDKSSDKSSETYTSLGGASEDRTHAHIGVRTTTHNHSSLLPKICPQSRIKLSPLGEVLNRRPV